MPFTPEKMQLIHPNDDMYHGSRKAYMYSGWEALKIIQKYTDIDQRTETYSFLDFPSGYGRVLRFIKGTYIDMDITACDLNEEAVDFCKENFLVKGVYSKPDLKDLSIDRRFSTIFSGSLLSHLSKEKFIDTIDFYYRHLRNHGFVVASTMGCQSAQELADKKRSLGINDHSKILELVESFNSTGFGFLPYEDNQDYGLTLIKPEVIKSIVAEFPLFNLVSIAEAEWSGFQDILVLQKLPE